jgi:hypothetical protein
MADGHPREAELAQWADQEAAGGMEHLHRCRRCQNAVNEYRWLQEGIVATLTAVAAAVQIPRPGWREVQGRLRASKRQLAATWRFSAVASAVLVVCVMLAAPSVLGSGVVARTLPPEAACAPPPAAAIAPSESRFSATTPTPVLPRGEATAPLTPPFLLNPTPPKPMPITTLP